MADVPRPASPPSAPAPAAADPGDLVGSFGERLEELDGRLHVVDTLSQARSRARELIAGADVARWSDGELDGIAEREASPDEAEVSLICADVAVADTGAIGFEHRAGRGRAAALLPTRQIALLAQADVVRTVAEALGRWFGEGAAAGNVVFAAGPSRTADIEQRVSRGVHAPRELDVILYRT